MATEVVVPPIEFWLGPENRVLVQVDEDLRDPRVRDCYATRLVANPAVRASGPRCRLRLRGPGGRTTEVSGQRLMIDDVAANGAANLPGATFVNLAAESKNALCSALRALFDDWTPAFIGSTGDGRRVAAALADLLGLKLVAYRVTNATLPRDILGDPLNRRTLQISPMYDLLRHGGVLVIEVPELSARVMKNLTMFTPFFRDLQRDLTLFGLPDDFEMHPDFHMVFNLPEVAIPIPSEVAGNLHFLWIAPECAEHKAPSITYEELSSGPGTSLVLMKFNVPEYESWFSTVIEPVVRRYGDIVRITNGLDEWRTEMRRVMERADAILVDVSHDLTADLSVNVIWELTQLSRSIMDKRLKRDRLLCFGRGLEGVPTRDGDAQFVWSRDVNSAWIPLPERSLNIDDLLGFRIRRYTPSEPASVSALCEWLEANLSICVQGVPAPITDSALRLQALETANQREHDDVAMKWLQAIADRDLTECWKLAQAHPPPPSILDLLGSLLTTISVSKVHAERGYWPLARLAIVASETLRNHFLRMLGTPQLHISHSILNHFRENIWLAFRTAELSKPDIVQLQSLAQLEADPDIRVVVESIMIGFLPEAEQHEIRVKEISEFYGITDLESDG